MFFQLVLTNDVSVCEFFMVCFDTCMHAYCGEGSGSEKLSYFLSVFNMTKLLFCNIGSNMFLCPFGLGIGLSKGVC